MIKNNICINNATKMILEISANDTKSNDIRHNKIIAIKPIKSNIIFRIKI